MIVSGRSGTLVGQGAAIIVTAGVDPLPRMLVDLWVVLGLSAFVLLYPGRASVVMGLFPARHAYYLFDWVGAQCVMVQPRPKGLPAQSTSTLNGIDTTAQDEGFTVKTMLYTLSNDNGCFSPEGRQAQLSLWIRRMEAVRYAVLRIGQTSYNKGWMSFVKRSGAAPVCHSKPLDSVNNWNDHFFWVDFTAVPLYVSLKSKILSKDPPPKLSQYDTEAWIAVIDYQVVFNEEFGMGAMLWNRRLLKDVSKVAARKDQKEQKRKVCLGNYTGSTFSSNRPMGDIMSQLPIPGEDSCR
ncbi:hypothetical protein Tco_0877509 [Tanacetum coccineum]|uniref:Aminotransferase-like plant mobile domain-containing protein n=1 Tax=Tanacetum coccineum TaxID=301880 RepID=A0ABQ5BWS9_9ASTR